MTIHLSQNYPHLFQETSWDSGITRVKFVLSEMLPPVHQISNINIVPRLQNKWVTICLEDGSWEIPGGTLEPNEDYLSAARRELLEEVGASLNSFHLIGFWHCISTAEKPYRPHLPFPEYYRIVGIGDVEIIKTPENPCGSEKVREVEVVSIENAIMKFLSSHRHDLADLYRL
jgi:8-oxo-dGTP pyrophosphatase MutT (NUDIX family)